MLEHVEEGVVLRLELGLRDVREYVRLEEDLVGRERRYRVDADDG